MNDVMRFYEQLQGEWKKRVKPHKCLGLAVEEDSLVAAEIYRRKEGFTIGKRARFELPEGASFDRPQPLGEALKHLLRDGGFAARKVVVGIPLKWMMAREMTLPPSPAHAVKGALKIHAEREFSLSPEDLALDYTGVFHADAPSRLVLSAMLKKRMDQIQEIVKSAGLEVLSIAPSSAVLFDLAGRNGSATAHPRFALLMRRTHAELLVRIGDEIMDVKYFQRHAESETVFLADLRRAIFSCLKGPPGNDKETIWLWSESGDLKNDAREIDAVLPPGMTAQGLPLAGILEDFGLKHDEKDLDLFVPSLALGLKMFREPAPSVPDFLNSRMEAKVGRIEKRHVRLAILVICALLVFLVGTVFSWKKNVNEVAELNKTLAGMQADVDIARDVVGKVSKVRKWYGKRPRVLDCIRELTLVFPEEGRVWSSSLALNEEMDGIISGKATNEEGVIEVMDKMKKSAYFKDVQMIYMRDSGNESQEISFSMSFIFEES
jgi:hypothetical protein